MTRRVVFSVVVLLALGACASPPDRPGTGEVLPPCGRFPNCVNSQSGDGVHAVLPLSATATQWDALKQWLRQQEGWRITVDQGLFLQCVATTPIMGFRDDVQLLYQPDALLIQVRSSSRMGFSDMGANRQRVEALRRELAGP
jgi:uncharacterized protein (DUF1499 family)